MTLSIRKQAVLLLFMPFQPELNVTSGFGFGMKSVLAM